MVRASRKEQSTGRDRDKKTGRLGKKEDGTMKALAGALTLAIMFAVFGTSNIDACGGMTTVNPPPLTLDDPVDPPSFDDEDPEELGDGECIL